LYYLKTTQIYELFFNANKFATLKNIKNVLLRHCERSEAISSTRHCEVRAIRSSNLNKVLNLVKVLTPIQPTPFPIRKRMLVETHITPTPQPCRQVRNVAWN
jgi:hypothetical protein